MAALVPAHDQRHALEFGLIERGGLDLPGESLARRTELARRLGHNPLGGRQLQIRQLRRGERIGGGTVLREGQRVRAAGECLQDEDGADGQDGDADEDFNERKSPLVMIGLKAKS